MAVLVAVTFAHGSGASFLFIAVLVLVLPVLGVVRLRSTPSADGWRPGWCATRSAAT
jgi:hypothetical protein